MITHFWVIIKNGCLFPHTTDKGKSNKVVDVVLFTVSLNVKTRVEAQTTSQVGENGTITVTTTTKHSTTKKKQKQKTKNKQKF